MNLVRAQHEDIILVFEEGDRFCKCGVRKILFTA